MKAAGQAGALALLAGLLWLSACSTSSPAKSRSSFGEADGADFIVRYYSDETSYVLKPPMMDGAFRSICDRAALLRLARQQPRRELAVVVLVHYPGSEVEEPVKLAWMSDLTGLGYRRIVFLRAASRMKVNGLLVLEGPHTPAAFAGK
jgi:hypothetical protein